MYQLPPLSLYVHIPWCIKKCPYCDFNSHTSNKIPEDIYINALLLDLKNGYQNCSQREITSIFFGGGTPSLLSAESIAFFIANAKKIVKFSHDIEITLEANPSTFEYVKFAQFRKAGINRLSIGVQSFNNYSLKGIGRIHSSEEAQLAIEASKKCRL